MHAQRPTARSAAVEKADGLVLDNRQMRRLGTELFPARFSSALHGMFAVAVDGGEKKICRKEERPEYSVLPHVMFLVHAQTGIEWNHRYHHVSERDGAEVSASQNQIRKTTISVRVKNAAGATRECKRAEGEQVSDKRIGKRPEGTKRRQMRSLAACLCFSFTGGHGVVPN